VLNFFWRVRSGLPCFCSFCMSGPEIVAVSFLFQQQRASPPPSPARPKSTQSGIYDLVLPIRTTVFVFFSLEEASRLTGILTPAGTLLLSERTGEDARKSCTPIRPHCRLFHDYSPCFNSSPSSHLRRNTDASFSSSPLLLTNLPKASFLRLLA